jgi:hypothetical protein
MSKTFLIDALEVGTRQKAFADWRFRPLPRRFGAHRFKVTPTQSPAPSASKSGASNKLDDEKD